MPVRQGHTAMSGPDAFRPVNRCEPCVICGKRNWCRSTADGAHECHRIDKPVVNGYERFAKTPSGFVVYRRPKDRRPGLWWISGRYKVDYWTNADQKHRCLAAALLDIERRLRKVRGCKQLVRLRTALQTHLKGCLEEVA